MADDDVKVGGVAGGLTSILRGFGWLVFTILTGKKFATHRIAQGARLVVGSIVLSAVIGAVMGSYHTSDDYNPYGWRYPRVYLSQFEWHYHSVYGAIGGAFLGAVLGVFLLLLTEEAARKTVKDVFTTKKTAE